jgi:hypothetical protein
MMFILPRSTSLGLYGRKNALPTLTINDIRDIISGNTAVENQKSRTTRSLVRNSMSPQDPGSRVTNFEYLSDNTFSSNQLLP